MMYWGNGMGAWGMALMIMGTLLFWGLIIAGVVALVRYTGRGTGLGDSAGTATTTTSQRILAERFARGDIDEEEYTHRLQVLGGAAQSSRASV